MLTALLLMAWGAAFWWWAGWSALYVYCAGLLFFAAWVAVYTRERKS